MKQSIIFAQVNTTGERTRVRRNHAKSKNGCNPCKDRRVKCDEQIPSCGACARKKLVCSRSRADDQSSENGQKEASINPPIQRDMNLLQLRLLHWFEHNTANTLALSSAWAKVIPLALNVSRQDLSPAYLTVRSMNFSCTQSL